MIAESGIETRAQAAAAELAGANAILVGSTLMRAADPGAKLRELVSRPLVKVCGLTRQEDVDAAVEAGADLVGFILAAESPRRAEALLDAPDTVLRVAVFVGEAEETDADLVQLYGRENGHRSRDAVLLARGEQVGSVVDLPWGEDDPTHLERAQARAGPRHARRRPRAARTSPRRSRRCGRGRSTPPARPSGTGDEGPRRTARMGGGREMSSQTFGVYGGRYVPETLIPALDELESAWASLRDDERFRAELA